MQVGVYAGESSFATLTQRVVIAFSSGSTPCFLLLGRGPNGVPVTRKASVTEDHQTGVIVPVRRQAPAATDEASQASHATQLTNPPRG